MRQIRFSVKVFFLFKLQKSRDKKEKHRKVGQ